jgi:hypothetical protein
MLAKQTEFRVLKLQYNIATAAVMPASTGCHTDLASTGCHTDLADREAHES